MGKKTATGTSDEGSGPPRLTKEDLDRIARTLPAFLKNSAASAVLLADKNGRILVQEGSSSNLGGETISAMVVESFEPHERLSGILGKAGFSSIYHQEGRDNLQISMVDKENVLLVVFSDKTTLGMVRLYSHAVSAKLAVLFEDIRRRRA